MTPTTLLSPIQLGDLMLKNRVIMAPLTRNRAGKDLAPTALNVTYYAQRASAGLIISEGTQIAADALGYPLTPGIHSPEQILGWQAVTKAVHEKRGKIFAQLWHCGRISHSSLLPNGMLPLAPSAIKPTGEIFTYEGMKPFETPQMIQTQDVAHIIEQYRHAARCALEAGFDGVEIHCANGYLLDQFLRDGTNQRTDQYGGSLENRSRFLLEVTQAICEIWPSSRIGVRLSPLNSFNDIRDSDPRRLFHYVVTQLNAFKLGYLHITEMGVETPDAAGPSFDLFELRDIWHGLYITNSQYDLKKANLAITQGKADMIAFGTLFLANPDLPRRFEINAPLNRPDPSTFYGGDAKGYIDYPSLAID